MTRFHNHSEIVDFWDIELAFLKLEMKVKLSHSLEDVAGSLSVGFQVGRGNEEVIHVDDQPSFSDHVLEGVVHESLECGRRVAEVKEHDSWFEESFMGDEGCLPLVTILDVDIVVLPINIKLGEVMGVFQLVHEIRDEGEGVGVAGDVFVEVSVVLARAKLAILLLDEEKEAWGELEGQIFLTARFSSRKLLVAFFSSGESG